MMQAFLRWGLILWFIFASGLLVCVGIARYLLPDSTLVFVTTNRAGEQQIAYDFDTGILNTLAHYENQAYLSNDGRQRAVLSRRVGTTIIDLMDVVSGEGTERFEMVEQVQSVWWLNGDTSLMLLMNTGSSRLQELDLATGNVMTFVDYGEFTSAVTTYYPDRHLLISFVTHIQETLRIGQIYLHDLETGRERHFESVRGFFRLNADITQLLYARIEGDDNRSQIYLYDMVADTNTLIEQSYRGNLTSFSFTPDDEHILYSTSQPDATYFYALATGEQEQLTEVVLLFRSASPDGRYLVASELSRNERRNAEQYLYDGQSQSIVQLRQPALDGDVRTFANQIAWSSDSERLAFLFDKGRGRNWVEVYNTHEQGLVESFLLPIDDVLPLSSGVAPTFRWYDPNRP